MEEMQRSMRRRVYSLEPNAKIYTGFPHKYVSHLLPALSKAATISGNKDENVDQKMVRFEVDMALALSASGFKWSRALKHKLEQCMKNSDQPHDHQPPTCQPNVVKISKRQMLCRQRRCNKKKKKTRGVEKEYSSYHMRILRRILPGGNENMGLCELLSEVESYAVCLQLQVNILKSLVETP